MNRYRFIAAEKAHYSVAQLCRVLQVAASGYYARRHRQPSSRARADAALIEQIRALYARSRCTYGAPRVHADLPTVLTGHPASAIIPHCDRRVMNFLHPGRVPTVPVYIFSNLPVFRDDQLYRLR